MGIFNLLITLKEISKSKNISFFKGFSILTKGLKLGVDIFCWIHQSISCLKSLKVSGSLVTDIERFQNSSCFLYFIEARLQMLLAHSIEPLFVFDGKKPKLKQRKKAIPFIKSLAPSHTPSELAKYKSNLLLNFHINEEVIAKVVSLLVKYNCKYIFAPYEADSQLSYLFKTNQIEGIISEDSDYIAHGCNNVITKLDKTGNCVVYSFDDLKDSRFRHFKETDFVLYCILCGCDYAKFKRVGPSKAFYLVTTSLDTDPIKTFETLISKVAEKEALCKAFIMFLKQIVKNGDSELETIFRNEEIVNYLVKKYDLIIDFII